jgi:pimeloyl-ACP methyl ester carboxylesterase
MLDISVVLGNWLLGQLETMPLDLLRRNALIDPYQLMDRILGRREAEEVRALLNRPASGGPRVPSVLLPGVMGSLLASVRGISTLLWFKPTVVLDGHINLLDLNDDGTADRSPDVEIVPVGIEKIFYLSLILTLARETRLYEFPYDWRRPLEWNAQLLHNALERWSEADRQRRFTLVGHSMGGMVARTYLALYPSEAEQHVERVILLGSPLWGVAIAALVFTGETSECEIMARLHPGNDVLRFTNNLPAVYQLLPPPPELFGPARHYPFNWDIYDARAWGVPTLRQDYLNHARRWHELVLRADTQVEVVEIAGCHQPTMTDVRCWPEGESDCTTRTVVTQERGADSGDDTVPLWSVQKEGMRTYYVEERHQNLPSNPAVLDAIVELAHGGTPGLPTELPEPSGLLGRLRSVPVIQQAADIRRRIEAGEFTRDDLRKLFFAG